MVEWVEGRNRGDAMARMRQRLPLTLHPSLSGSLGSEGLPPELASLGHDVLVSEGSVVLFELEYKDTSIPDTEIKAQLKRYLGGSPGRIDCSAYRKCLCS